VLPLPAIVKLFTVQSYPSVITTTLPTEGEAGKVIVNAPV
jgi:hypothetical protein